MIKHVPDIKPNILTFYVETEIDQEDVKWMVRLIETTYQRQGNRIKIYVEFGPFGLLTPKRTLKHWKMLVSHAKSLTKHVSKILTTTDSIVLRSKLIVEFNMLPNVSLRAYKSKDKEKGLKWIEKNIQQYKSTVYSRYSNQSS